MGLFSSPIKTLDDLFNHTLQDIYYAENQITKNLPTMVEKASNPELKSAFQKHLAETQGLPKVYANVIRWIDTPALATEHMDLIAMVALARHVCMHARVGCSGDTPAGEGALAATPAWSMLQPRLFPSFDLKKFEVQAHAFCLTVKNELSGQIGERRPSHAQRAAELV